MAYYNISREKMLCALQHKRIPEELQLFGDSFSFLGRGNPRLDVDIEEIVPSFQWFYFS